MTFTFYKKLHNSVFYTDGNNLALRIQASTRFLDCLLSNKSVKFDFSTRILESDILIITATKINNRTGKVISENKYLDYVNDLPSLRKLVAKIIKENRRMGIGG